MVAVWKGNLNIATSDGMYNLPISSSDRFGSLTEVGELGSVRAEMAGSSTVYDGSKPPSWDGGEPRCNLRKIRCAGKSKGFGFLCASHVRQLILFSRRILRGSSFLRGFLMWTLSSLISALSPTIGLNMANLPTIVTGKVTLRLGSSSFTRFTATTTL